MDTLPLPPRPRLEQYRKRAKALVNAVASSDPQAIGDWANQWLLALAKHLDVQLTPFVKDSMTRAVEHIERAIREKQRTNQSARFTLADAQRFIAEAHSFASWDAFAEHVRQFEGDARRGDDFEAAADAIVTGDIQTLTALLRRKPELISARSKRVHRATLLHYVAANGVEDFRQKTPPNAIDIARSLLDAGAEVDALANTYGGGPAQTTLNLLVSSAHPASAGLQAPLAELLLDRGAALNGVADDSSPLVTALAFGYPRSMYAIAVRGARIDGPIPAAALGRLDLVRYFVRDRFTLAPNVLRHGPRWFQPPADPKTHIEHAFLAACKFGHVEVAQFFLDLGVDVAARDDMTALHWAAAFRYVDVVRLLLAAGAPLEVRNTWGGTVLDSTVWFVKNPPAEHPYNRADVGYMAILEMLIAAGADVEEVTPFPSGVAEVDDLLRRHGHS